MGSTVRSQLLLKFWVENDSYFFKQLEQNNDRWNMPEIVQFLSTFHSVARERSFRRDGKASAAIWSYSGR